MAPSWENDNFKVRYVMLVNCRIAFHKKNIDINPLKLTLNRKLTREFLNFRSMISKMLLLFFLGLNLKAVGPFKNITPRLMSVTSDPRREMS